MKNCKDCVYFGDFKDTTPNSRFKWTHCLGQVYNLNDETADKCDKYAETITDALMYEAKKHAKWMNWDFPINFKLPNCEPTYFLTNISKSVIEQSNINQLKEICLECYTLSRMWYDKHLEGKAAAYEDVMFEIAAKIKEKENI
jgi:hypothetical protein